MRTRFVSKAKAEVGSAVFILKVFEQIQAGWFQIEENCIASEKTFKVQDVDHRIDIQFAFSKLTVWSFRCPSDTRQVSPDETHGICEVQLLNLLGNLQTFYGMISTFVRLYGAKIEKGTLSPPSDLEGY